MRHLRMFPIRTFLVILVGLSLAPFAWASVGTHRQEVPSSRSYGDDITLDQLHEAAHSAHVITRIDAIRRIATDANPASLQLLIEALEDSDPTVREVAAIGLARLAQPESVPALVRAMQDENAAVRSQAAVAISGIKPSSAVVLGFLAGLDDQTVKIDGRKGRQAATFAASSRVTGTARANREPGQGSLVMAKKVLRRLVTAEPSTVDSLITMLTDANLIKRYTTAYALSTSANSEVVAALNRALISQDIAVVSGAYEFYLAHQMNEAKPILLQGLARFDDPDLILAMSRCGDSDLEFAAAQIANDKGIWIGN